MSTEALAGTVGKGVSSINKLRAVLARRGWLKVIQRGPKPPLLKAVVPREGFHSEETLGDKAFHCDETQGAKGFHRGCHPGETQDEPSLYRRSTDTESRADGPANPSPGPSGKMADALARYDLGQRATIDAAFSAFASTRATGRMADSVRLNQLRQWERYSPEQVVAGLETYLAKGYAEDGRAEAYALGIIRNTRPDAVRLDSARRQPTPRYQRL